MFFAQLLIENPKKERNLNFSNFSGPSASTRPVTVRSVKRRDKAKIEERRLSAQAQTGNGNNKIQQQPRSLDDRTNAVMV